MPQISSPRCTIVGLIMVSKYRALTLNSGYTDIAKIYLFWCKLQRIRLNLPLTG